MPPAPASTVVLVRDCRQGIEVYLLRRVTSMAFAPSMHVFPGGRVDDRDYDVAVSFAGPHDENVRLAARAGADEPLLRALYVCAIRETEEESGVVLALAADDGGLLIDAAAMPIIDHWITPEIEPRRYDTRFFAAVLPVEQGARLTTTEADRADWVLASTAVELFEAGQMAMMPPTITVLRYVSGFDRCEEMLADGAGRPVVPILPILTRNEDGSIDWRLGDRA